MGHRVKTKNAYKEVIGSGGRAHTWMENMSSTFIHKQQQRRDRQVLDPGPDNVLYVYMLYGKWALRV